MKTALVIGGGFAGCAAAHQLALMGGWDVTVVEMQPFLGAGVRTMWYGGHPHTLGPRPLLTPKEEIYHLLNKNDPLPRRHGHDSLTHCRAAPRLFQLPPHPRHIR